MKKKIKKFLEINFVENFVILLILVNFAAFILQTDVNIAIKYKNIFYWIEFISVAVFSVEYFLRFISVEKISDIFKPLMIIDFIAIAPFYMSFLTINTVFLRIFRVIRVLRVAKMARYTNAINLIKSALIKRKDELVVAGCIFFVAVLFSSIAIYFAENQTGNLLFRSVISSFWWSIVTITTVGYGDSVPITAIGKLIASVTAIFGVGIHGLLIGIISSAIYDMINNKNNCPHG